MTGDPEDSAHAPVAWLAEDLEVAQSPLWLARVRHHDVCSFCKKMTDRKFDFTAIDMLVPPRQRQINGKTALGLLHVGSEPVQLPAKGPGRKEDREGLTLGVCR